MHIRAKTEILMLASIAILMLIAIGCMPSEPEPIDISEPPVATSGGDSGVAGNSGNTSSNDSSWQRDQMEGANRLLQQGRVDEAILLLEGMAENEPGREDIIGPLIEAHSMYADQVSRLSNSFPMLVNQVLYSHYSRILELDPENADAKSGLELVTEFYGAQNLSLPEEIDPTLLLSDLQSVRETEPAIQPTE